MEFFQTHMGQKFYDVDVPQVVRALTRIADSLEKKTEPRPLTVDRDEVPLSVLKKLSFIIHQEKLQEHFPVTLLLHVQDLLAGTRESTHDNNRNQPLLADILDRAEHERGIPGIAFPIDHSAEKGYFESEDGQVFISRSDQAGMFRSDVDAANFVSCLTGIPWKKCFDDFEKGYFFPYFEITLAQAQDIHDRFGSVAPKKEGG